MALGALEPEPSISLKESMRELNRRFTDVDSVFSSLSYLIENGLYYGQNKH